MKNPKIHIAPFDGYKAQYVLFDSAYHFHDFIAQQEQKLQPNNARILERLNWNTDRRINQETSWYGLPAPKSTAELANHNRYIDMKLVKTLQEKIGKILVKRLLSMKDAQLEIPALQLNSKGLGVFSFAHAAMGLHRQQPTITNPPLQELLTQLRILNDTGNKVTSIRSSFLHFAHRSVVLPTVTLYIMAGSNARIQGDQLRYVGLGAAVLTQYLEARGIALQIHVLLGTFFNKTLHTAIIKVKDYGDPLDLNTLLYLSSDPRYFRYRGIKGIISLCNYFDKKIPIGMGMIKTAVGKKFIHTIQPNAVIFENSFSIDSAAKEITNILSNHIKNEDG